MSLLRYTIQESVTKFIILIMYVSDSGIYASMFNHTNNNKQETELAMCCKYTRECY